MKRYNKYLFILLGAASFASCNLDRFPESDTITGDQKKEIAIANPDRLAADINGLAAGLISTDVISTALDSYHYDFGHAALCITFESSGQDFVAPNVGYNWFRGAMTFADRVYSSMPTQFIWKLYYNHMKTANDILSIVPADTKDPMLKSYRGQALASRAFDYMQLVQVFQFTYAGHKDALAVPIVTETSTMEQISNNPRSTVSQVYDCIMSDLNESIVLLTGYNRKSKDVIDAHVAYGLRARANLLMQNWSAAAQDAQKAMDGFTPYSLTDVSVPTFNTAESSSWIWANLITPDNDIVKTGILNWPSMLCSLTGNGYTTGAKTWRKISLPLWNQISNTDVRKGWWVDANLKSPLTDKIFLTNPEDGKDYPASVFFDWQPYTNVKFHAYKSIPNNTVNASDWPMMRAEEMIFIQVEGLAMSGSVQQAKNILEDFVKSNRDPSYVCNASNSTDLQNEVWFQRRIELWGEGFAFFDLLRLKKPINRIVNGVSNYPAACKYNLDPESPIMIYRIPESEMTVNSGIKESDNNPSVTPPVAK